MAKFTEPRKAFESGVRAKKHGWARMSPFYDDETADEYFFYGYDGSKTEDELFPKPVEEKKEEPTLAESFAEPGTYTRVDLGEPPTA